ncbi:MAG: PAS domain S-box protein [Candidatus Omnitrophota bacterium]
MPLPNLILIISFLLALGIGISLGLCISRRPKAVFSRLESLTELAAGIPIQGFDKEGTIFLWNRASELIYGFLRQDAIGKKITELILNDCEKDVFLNDVANIYETGKPLPSRQWMITTHSGKKRTMYSTMFPYMVDEKCQSVFCFDIDITDLQQHQKILADSRADYEAIFDGIEEAICVIDPHDGKIIFANAKGCELTGYSEEELLKMSMADFSSGDRSKVNERSKALTAKAFYEGTQHFDLELVKKNGECFDAKVHLKKSMITNKECVIATIRDFSAWKEKDQELKTTQRRYKDLMYNSNSLIYHLDPNGIVTNVNEAVKKIFGFEIAEVVGNHFAAFLHESEHKRGEDTFNQVISGGLMNDIEFRGLARGNREIVLKGNIWPEFDENENIIGIHGDAIDVTDQKTLLNKMREMVIQIISMLSETVSVADRYTEKHCERLQDLSLKIGEQLGLEEKQLEHLKFAALLHDVGKVGVPIHILIKKGKLTDEEWQKIKEHPKKGADIIRQLNGFEEVAEIIEQHQERFDGKGYPLGLLQNKIKKEAAIISVVDAFDAMTSDRPYRKAMSIEEAIEELKVNSGTQFAPDVVEAFIRILELESQGNSA